MESPPEASRSVSPLDPTGFWRFCLIDHVFETIRIERAVHPFPVKAVEEGTHPQGSVFTLGIGDRVYYKRPGYRWCKKFSLNWWRRRPFISFGYTWGPRKGRWPLMPTPYYPALVYRSRVRRVYRGLLDSLDGSIPVRSDLEGYWWKVTEHGPVLHFNILPIRGRSPWSPIFWQDHRLAAPSNVDRLVASTNPAGTAKPELNPQA